MAPVTVPWIRSQRWPAAAGSTRRNCARSSASRGSGTPPYVYAHFVVYLGLAAVGPGTLLAIEAANDSALPAGARAALCGGTALYLLGLCLVAAPTRRSPSGRRRIAARCIAAAAAVAIAFLGAAIPPWTTVVLLAAVAVSDLVYELVAGGDPSDPAVSPLDLPERA